MGGVDIGSDFRAADLVTAGASFRARPGFQRRFDPFVPARCCVSARKTNAPVRSATREDALPRSRRPPENAALLYASAGAAAAA